MSDKLTWEEYNSPTREFFIPDRPKKGGRPKGARNLKTVAIEFANKRHKVRGGDGRVRSVNTVELLLEILKRKSMSGDVEADKILEGLRDRFAPPSQEVGYLVVREPLSQEEFIREARIESAEKQRPDSARTRHSAATAVAVPTDVDSDQAKIDSRPHARVVR